MPRRKTPVIRLLWLGFLVGLTLACSRFSNPQTNRLASAVTPAVTVEVSNQDTPLHYTYLPRVEQRALPTGVDMAPDEAHALPADAAAGESKQTAEAAQTTEPPFLARHVIVFIGDGMGPEQVKAAGMYLHGSTGELSFERFPYQSEMTTYSAGGNLTDSAAAATAMATGQKVNNEVIGLALPGDGSELFTLLEYAQAHGLSTGLVTTTPITHATPAGFGAHVDSRHLPADIANDYLSQTRPNVLFGGGGAGMEPEPAVDAGYTLVTNRENLLSLDTEAMTYVSGQFGIGALPFEVLGLGDQPHLWEMTDVALRILDNDPDGLFVVIEGGLIDHAGHTNQLHALIGEMVEFDHAVQEALDWAARNPDTLIVVLADHETGGLQVIQNNGQGSLPGVTWATNGHTQVNVPVYLTGLVLEDFPALLDNTDIPALLSGGKFHQP